MKTTIQLGSPIAASGGTFGKLNMRAPKVRDLLAVDKIKGDAAKEIRLFANLCEVPPEVVEELDLRDYTALQEAYRGFLS